jgi:hypothetical protein
MSLTVDDVSVVRPSDFKMKLEEKRTYRIAFLWLDEKGKVLIEPVKFYRRFDKEPIPEEQRIKVNFRDEGLSEELSKKVEEICGEVKERYVTPVLIYLTDNNGEVRKSAIGDYDLKLWVFGLDTLSQIKNISKKYNLGEIDISMTCKDTYYNVSLLPERDCIFRGQDKDKFDRSKIKSDYEAAMKHLKDVVAVKLQEHQIRAALKLQSYEVSEDDGYSVATSTYDHDDLPF